MRVLGAAGALVVREDPLLERAEGLGAERDRAEKLKKKESLSRRAGISRWPGYG
ncbi:MAG: hypothetical protein ABJA82_08840 [Myxococcales bacterium]